jgi:lipopolysaccharide/colanic/teichoic acid biosynthesis glycosyltransferase
VYEDFGKRCFDLLVATFVLTLATPVMLLIALAIRLDSRGPVFFRQERVGQGKQRFTLVKFRTMRERPANEIDQRSEKVLLNCRDQRITRVGRILRRLSLDELPQIWNVLNGDMSVVGPRPIIPEQLDALGAEADGRFSVRPGITGLAQVNGRRSLSWPLQLAHDVEYACHVSFAKDVIIIFRTFGIILSGSGIYGREEDNWRQHIRK